MIAQIFIPMFGRRGLWPISRETSQWRARVMHAGDGVTAQA